MACASFWCLAGAVGEAQDSGCDASIPICAGARKTDSAQLATTYLRGFDCRCILGELILYRHRWVNLQGR